MKELEKTSHLNHLDEMTCLLYLEKQLDRARGQEVSAHTQECAACRTLMRALERESRLLTRSMLEEDEPLPARLAQFQERARRSMQWIWGAVFGLAATGMYALYTGYIEPWQQRLDQVGFGGFNLLSLLIFQGVSWKGWQSVISLIEIIALMTIAGLSVLILRRRLRRGGGSAMAVMLSGLAAVLALPGPASATEFRHKELVEVTEDEHIKGDFFASGDRVKIEGTVDGDVFAVGREIEIDGHVLGDVISANHTLRIVGQVDGNVRSADNTLVILGSVGKNVLVFGDAARIESTGKVGGSFTVFSGSSTIDGKIQRDVLYKGGVLSVSGKIQGDVRASGESLVISSTAEIDGPVNFEGAKSPEVSPQAKLASPVAFKQMEHRSELRNAHYYIWQIVWAAAFVLFGLVLFLLLPDFSREAVGGAERYGAAAGLGVLVTFGVPVAAFIACITVVGLFVGLSTFFLWYASLYYGQVVIGTVIGQWILGRTRELWPLIGRMIIGLLIVRACTTIPHAGFWIKLGFAIWGLGGISIAIYHRFQPVVGSGVPSVPIMPTATVGGMQPA